jgi:hypothetical protein
MPHNVCRAPTPDPAPCFNPKLGAGAEAVFRILNRTSEPRPCLDPKLDPGAEHVFQSETGHRGRPVATSLKQDEPQRPARRPGSRGD